MTAVVIRGDARRLPLPDASVDLIVTSPPYFALRSYTDGGEHYAGQIGSEASPAAYIGALLDCTREWVRCLKPTGSMWINLGDKYSGAQAQNIGGANRAGDSARTWRQTDPRRTGIPNKSLMGLPWRYALGCIDDLGLILRAEIVWSKPNGLPESVTDRVRRSHEQWFHLVKQPRYFAAVDEIREAHIIGNGGRQRAAGTDRYADYESRSTAAHRGLGLEQKQTGLATTAPNPLGKLPGSVWNIPSEPLTVPDYYIVQGGRTVHYAWTRREAWAWMRNRGTSGGRPSARRMVDHFAAFPSEWPRRIILGWSPSGICTACGEGRRPVGHVDYTVDGAIAITDKAQQTRLQGNTFATRALGRAKKSTTITGYVCGCVEPTAPTTPATVLDPFGGTGTVALAADTLGRTGISVDMSADYNRLAQWRTQDPGQRAKVLGVPKPPVELDGQDSLFNLEAAS